MGQSYKPEKVDDVLASHCEEKLNFATKTMANASQMTKKTLTEIEVTNFLDNFTLLKDVTFSILDEEDMRFRVVESGMTGDLRDPFWEILFEGTGHPIRVGIDELRKLLNRSKCTYYRL